MTIGLLFGVTCTCLVVGIYFFFVRSRPNEQTNNQQS